MSEKLLGMYEAVEYLREKGIRLSEASLRNMVAKSQIKTKKVFSSRVISIEELNKIAEERRAPISSR